MNKKKLLLFLVRNEFDKKIWFENQNMRLLKCSWWEHYQSTDAQND
jgi:hypothetical protein